MMTINERKQLLSCISIAADQLKDLGATAPINSKEEIEVFQIIVLIRSYLTALEMEITQ